MIKIGLLGSSGRTGSFVLEIASQDPFRTLLSIREKPRRTDPLSNLFTCDGIIDFSTSDALDALLSGWKKSTHKPFLVTGTTGLPKKIQSRIEELSKETKILQDSNFSLSIAWVNHLCATFPPFLKTQNPRTLIKETHHQWKKDAPSGTALSIERALHRSGQQLTSPIESIREGDVVGIHEVRFQFRYEQVSVIHEALDRKAFAEGALNAALWLSKLGKPCGLFSVQDMILENP